MKNKMLNFARVIVTLAFISCSCLIKAQAQSMLLPIPGTYYTANPDLDGCKIINFSNSNNTTINNLPKTIFYVNGLQGKPHYEQDLISNDGLLAMGNYYVGQHPMFAQQVIHDKDGNLLFFIVDNNIYNRYGEANKLRMKNKLM